MKVAINEKRNLKKYKYRKVGKEELNRSREYELKFMVLHPRAVSAN